MEMMTLWRSRERLSRELVSWQRAAVGLFALSLLFNLAAMIGLREECMRQEKKVSLLESKLTQAEHTRDLAVQELGAMSIRQAGEREAREELAAAYEMIGEYRYIGECTITAYCPCSECCGRWADGLTATGLTAGPGIVAVDPEVIPLGSTVIIDGLKYLAADVGVSGKHVDIAVSSHEQAVELGVRSEKVWVCEAP